MGKNIGRVIFSTNINLRINFEWIKISKMKKYTAVLDIFHSLQLEMIWFKKTLKIKKGSFEFITSPIPELGEQTGWEGSFEFKGEPGDYNLNFWFPLTEPTNQGDRCNFVSSFSIPTIINQ